jgi:hypothetical protein
MSRSDSANVTKSAVEWFSEELGMEGQRGEGSTCLSVGANYGALCKERAQPSEQFVSDIILCAYKTLFDQAVLCEIIRLTEQSVFPLWVIYNHLCTDRFRRIRMFFQY